MVLIKKVDDFEAKGGTMAIENRHLSIISDMSDDGYIVNGGPLESGVEVLIFQDTSKVDVPQLLKRDPAIGDGLYEYEVYNWTLRYGRVCPPSAPYEIRTYSFVRFSIVNSIASYKAREDLQMKLAHQHHMESVLQTGDVIAEGFFDKNDGSVIIYREKKLDAILNENPAVQRGYLRADFETIWLNKGSFCED